MTDGEKQQARIGVAQSCVFELLRLCDCILRQMHREIKSGNIGDVMAMLDRYLAMPISAATAIAELEAVGCIDPLPLMQRLGTANRAVMEQFRVLQATAGALRDDDPAEAAEIIQAYMLSKLHGSEDAPDDPFHVSPYMGFELCVPGDGIGNLILRIATPTRHLNIEISAADMATLGDRLSLQAVKHSAAQEKAAAFLEEFAPAAEAFGSAVN